MRSFLCRVMLFPAVVVAVVVTAQCEARADGYVYEARSYYIAPVATYYPPVYAPPPYAVYEPVYVAPSPVVYTPAYVAPAPVVGYYYPAPAVPVRTHESWSSHPWRSRYKYEVKYPGGLEYEYHYKRDGGRIRVTGKWDD